MKPPPFTYHRPETVAEAVGLLADLGDEAKVLAGGQSLVPLLNFRLAAPAHLVDITRIEQLDGIGVEPDAVFVGAAVRQAALEHHAAAVAAIPLLGEALAHVAHGVIRNRGTVVGSLAHADPASELVATLAVLDGTVQVVRRGVGGELERRVVPAAELFAGPMTTALEADELVEWATFRPPPAGAGAAVVELARRHGDYALAGVVAVVTVGDDGVPATARLGLLAVDAVPVVVDLGGEAADPRAVAEAARAASSPSDDIHATAPYRRHLVGVLARRAVEAAAGRARVAREGRP